MENSMNACSDKTEHRNSNFSFMGALSRQTDSPLIEIRFRTVYNKQK